MLESARLPHAFARATSAGPARIPRIPSVPHIPPVPHIPSTPLVFNDSIDTANMANVLLIDSTLADKQVFYDSANANTFPVIYNSTSKTDELLALFRRKFPGSSIQRISLAFHGRGGNFMARFMNNKALFEDGDLAENQTSFSDNVSFLIGCIKEFHVSHIDFLACNTLQYSNWKSYYGLLASQTSVVVGASNDATGNIKYGGDWIMESNGEDIKQIYFTDGIDYYKYLLDEITIDGIIYSYTSGPGNTAYVINYVPGIEIANIPSTITISDVSYNVTSIVDSAFYDCTSLTSVTIGNSVETIGNSAFESCSALTSVTIGNSVTTIGDYAFSFCSALTSVTIGNSVTSIGDGTFYNCSALTSVTIPDSVTSIGNNAFVSCSALASVTIPNSVISIQNYAFYACTSLASVTIGISVTTIGNSSFRNCSALNAFAVDASNNNYSSDSGVLFDKLKTILIQYPIGNTRTSYTIPSSVETIGDFAVYDCTSLTSVTIPNSVETIGDYAFQNCSALTSVTIPNSVTSIGDYAFYACSALTSVTISDSVTSIGYFAFQGCSALTAFAVDASNNNYSNDAFGVLFDKLQTTLIQYPAGNTQTTYTIPDSLTTIGEGAFAFCSSLTSVTIPDSVTSIGSNAFDSCSSLTSVTIPDSVTSIGSNVFFSCISLASVTIGNSVTSIGSNVFFSCISLASVTISNSVTSIGGSAFNNCTALTSVTIGNSVTTIGNSAFQNCSALTAFAVDASNNNYSNDAFGVLFNNDKTTLIQYPIGNTRTSYTIPNSVTTIGDSAFENCSSLTSVTIPDFVTTIGDYAFSYCTALTSVTIPDSVTTIGYSAFENCSSLTAINVDGGNLNYSNDAFGVLFNNDKTTLIQYPIGNTQTSYTIPDSVTNIENSAFAFCSALTAINVDGGNLDYSSDAFGVLFNILQTTLIQYPIGNTQTSYTIPSSVTNIGDYAFALCSSLTAINVDGGNLDYSSDAFGVLFNNDKTDLIQYPIGNTQTSYTIPSSVETIGSYVFAECSALTSVTIPSSVVYIDSYVFQGCSNLNLVYFLQTPTLPNFQPYTFTGISVSSVGKYYSSVTNSSFIAPYFNSISEISNTIPTLTSITPFTSTSTSAVVTISYANLVTNGNEVVDNNPYVFLVNAVSSGSLLIGATQGTATPWNATTNKTIAAGNNAYWSPPPGSANGLLNAFSVVVQDAVGEVSSPNVDVQVNAQYPCFLEGTKILCFKNNQEVYCPVESLQKGDLVKTIYNGYMPICMMGTTALYNPGNDYRVTNRLYKCPKEKYPTLFEDLYITGCHSILVPWMTNDQWENTKAVNGNIYVTDNHFRLIACADEKAEPYNKEGFMNIYHIALDHHDICMNYGIYANGLLVESCSIEYLIKYSNLKILAEADSAISDDFVQVSNNMGRQLVDTY